MQKSKNHTLAHRLIHIVFCMFVVFSSLWLCCALWIQQPFGLLFSRLLLIIWIILACRLLRLYFTPFFSHKKEILLYISAFILALLWYFSLTPRQDRDWSPEVSQTLNYTQHGDIVTLYNVRNFDWQPDGSYIEHWEQRTFDLTQISGVNIIGSYWMGPKIAHTLVSFDFYNSRPLTFSIEIRKEKFEEFSAIGGFFRQFELSLIAADEKDIVFTRSNIRKEQVYFFPIQMAPTQRRALFQEYLNTAHELAQQPKWYNTLTSNCTTLVFDMVQAVSNQRLPVDYRLLASGYLPNYLYDLKVLQQDIDLKTWYKTAHVNPKTQGQQDLSSTQYSVLMRSHVVRP